ncbi:MAG: UTP--glucose-1-phosphate uridylyltransferase [Desulfobulbaceae bacterium]|nr:UTP--glucose-1-phosphate uridylyltransferase [Desulfobulbaceae bacterium]
MELEIKETIVARRMEKRGLMNRDISFFLSAWRHMTQKRSVVDWKHIKPVTGDQVFKLPEETSLKYNELYGLGEQEMSKCAIVKLNGGRATTMGGTVPKCMIPVKNEKNFLDIVMGQIMASNDRNGIEMPLILMNSFFTDHVTEKIVGQTPLIIMNFIQNEYPRIREDNLMPLDTGTDDDWCPAGHGDFFSSLEGSGCLDGLLELGYTYAFISNIDNLSAEVSPVILGQMVSKNHDFMMEVTKKTANDIKGGAPVRYNGNLSLLEIAEVPQDNMADFQDIEKFQFFNTNNLWIDLKALKKLITEQRLNLPIIQNRKNICERDIIQIETAMGAGLQCFSSPGLVEVPRNRFTPVKKMEDLVELQSDLYTMNTNYQLQKKTAESY